MVVVAESFGLVTKSQRASRTSALPNGIWSRSPKNASAGRWPQVADRSAGVAATISRVRHSTRAEKGIFSTSSGAASLVSTRRVSALKKHGQDGVKSWILKYNYTLESRRKALHGGGRFAHLIQISLKLGNVIRGLSTRGRRGGMPVEALMISINGRYFTKIQ